MGRERALSLGDLGLGSCLGSATLMLNDLGQVISLQAPVNSSVKRVARPMACKGPLLPGLILPLFNFLGSQRWPTIEEPEQEAFHLNNKGALEGFVPWAGAAGRTTGGPVRMPLPLFLVA